MMVKGFDDDVEWSALGAEEDKGMEKAENVKFN